MTLAHQKRCFHRRYCESCDWWVTNIVFSTHMCSYAGVSDLHRRIYCFCYRLTHPHAPAVQATEAETKEDREIICEEVFCDITGQLDYVAKGQQVA